MASSLLSSSFTLSALILLSLCLGCERKAPSPELEPHDHSAQLRDQEVSAEVAPAQAEGPAGPRVETGMFALSLAPGKAGFAVGKAGELQIQLEGRGDWHVNQDYPIRVKIAADEGLSVHKAELVRADAKRFDEQQVEFLAHVQPSAAGEHGVECEVSFAMCTEENCIREKRTVAMVLKAD